MVLALDDTLSWSKVRILFGCGRERLLRAHAWLAMDYIYFLYLHEFDHTLHVLALAEAKHFDCVLPSSFSYLLNTDSLNTSQSNCDLANRTGLIPPLYHSSLHPLLLLHAFEPLLLCLSLWSFQELRAGMTCPHLAPRAIRF